jgi:catechol 2,3-dioxygenase-like lactoylglutathione lyase family enzyme
MTVSSPKAALSLFSESPYCGSAGAFGAAQFFWIWLMKFVNPLPFVSDIKRSKEFYSGVLGLSIREDHGSFVMFEQGFAIHDGATLFRTVFSVEDTTSQPYGRANLVLYFEVPDLDAAYCRISPKVVVIHQIRTEPWGQRVFRFFDPDKHIVELGEPQ